MDPWAASGAMALTGRAEGPGLDAPGGVVARMEALGAGLGIDVLPLLTWRAEALRLTRLGAVSCGGACRLLPTADGWVAVNLARDDDVDSIPAWLEVDLDGEPWSVVRRAVATRTSAAVVERATLLALPVAAVGEVAATEPVVRTRLGEADPTAARPLVVDLSSLWAGPLCARLLADRGARVIKVESAARPDGARLGPAAFYDRLHHDTEGIVLDFGSAAGRDALRRLLDSADVVIEGSRPRALRHLGIERDQTGARVWVAITGHGQASDRVAFGDDAAAAGGLVAWPDDGRGPCFVADAVADPLTGVAAAAATVAALEAGGRWLLDVALARVAATVAGGSTGRWRPGTPPTQ